MHPADKAVLRLGVGLGLAVLIAYGLAVQIPFIVCVVSAVLLTKPGPPIPFVKGAVFGAVVAALLVAGVLMVPILEHYRVTGLLLTGALLYAVFFAGARSGNPLTILLVVACAFIPAAGVAEQALAMAIGQAFGLGLAVGALVSGLSHALFPDPPGPAPIPAPRVAVSREAAGWSALQAALVIMPVFVLALINPAHYVSGIIKTALLSQQAGATNARTAGRELVGSTCVGALMAMVVWAGLTLKPNLWMLMLWIVAAALWAGVRLFRIKPTSEPPSFWVNVLVTMLILIGPGIEDAAAGKDVYKASAFRVTLFIAVALYAWATVWVLERWRASGSGALAFKRT